MIKRIIIIASLIIVAAIGLFIFNYACAIYKGTPVRIEVYNTDDSQEVRQAIDDALGQDMGARVYTMWKLQRGKARTACGSYLVSPGDKAYGIARRLVTGRQTPVKFTFNNLRTVGDLANRASVVFRFDSASFCHAADSVGAGRFSKEMLPAAFLNDTHEFYRTATPSMVVSRLLADRDSYWNEERRQKAAELGLTPDDVHIIASIVEAETAKSDEKPLVARLYINRLKQGMPLQADPTVKFALGDFGLRRITHEHLKVDSPYNTYLWPGLPPGPISIVDKDAIDAVLTAPPGNQLYMCARADMSGYHVFASDYNRHRINAALYHRALNARGIK